MNLQRLVSYGLLSNERTVRSCYLSPFILCRFLEGLPPGVDSLCDRLVCRRSSTSTASTSKEPPRPTSLSLGSDLACLETPISMLCLTSRRARSAGGGGVAILPGVCMALFEFEQPLLDAGRSMPLNLSGSSVMMGCRQRKIVRPVIRGRCQPLGRPERGDAQYLQRRPSSGFDERYSC